MHVNTDKSSKWNYEGQAKYDVAFKKYDSDIIMNTKAFKTLLLPKSP